MSGSTEGRDGNGNKLVDDRKDERQGRCENGADDGNRIAMNSNDGTIIDDNGLVNVMERRNKQDADDGGDVHAPQQRLRTSVDLSLIHI